MDPVAVFYLTAGCADSAAELAERADLPLIDARKIQHARRQQRRNFVLDACSARKCLAFRYSDEGLDLLQVDAQGELAIGVDFTSPAASYRRRQGGKRNEAIARAVGLRGGESPAVLDATAGLGGDAFVLASLGCRVDLVERVPALWELLADGLERARRSNDRGLVETLGRMNLLAGDSIGYLERLAGDERPEVIYLDPMFPERQKSAAVKKEMQVCQNLVGPDADAPVLLELALRQAQSRVVVKRPRHAAPIEGPPPNHVLSGVRNRFDLYKRQV